MTTDATQQGVSKTQDEIDAENQAMVADIRKNTQQARVSAVQEVAEGFKETREAEIAESGQPAATTTVDGDELQPASQEEEQPKPASEQQTQQAEKPKEELENNEEMVILKVDGVDKEVPRSKVLEAGTRALQKDYTADSRLEEATRILKEAQETATTLRNPSSQPSTSQADVDDTPAVSQEDMQELAKTLVDGDVDQVADALGKIVGNGRQHELATQAKNMQPNEVMSMVRDVMDMDAALDLFQKPVDQGGYGDLYADDNLKQMVFDEEAKLAEGENAPKPSERLKQAAEKVRSWRDQLVGKPENAGNATGSEADFSQRQEQKKQTSSTPNTAGGRQQTTTAEQPKSEAELRREALDKMARARGQHLD